MKSWITNTSGQGTLVTFFILIFTVSLWKSILREVKSVKSQMLNIVFFFIKKTMRFHLHILVSYFFKREQLGNMNTDRSEQFHFSPKIQFLKQPEFFILLLKM